MSVAAVYVPAPSKGNLRIGQTRAVWGWKDDTVAKGRTREVLDSLRPGDVLLLGHRGPNARVAPGEWADAVIRELTIAKVVTTVYPGAETVWPDDLYPHRIGLDVLDIVDTGVTGAQLGAEVAEALRLSANKQGAPVLVEAPGVFEHLVDATSQPPAVADEPAASDPEGAPDAGVTELENRFLDIRADFDRPTVTLARREQAKLRRLKFRADVVIGCALCGRTLPTRLVRAAHIKRRSICSSIERRDLENLMPACVLGCDALFEDGFVYVDEGGTVRASSAAEASHDLLSAAGALAGTTCTAFGEESAVYFGWHREEIAKVGPGESGGTA
ncbi:hypothetical protein [Kitasatospora sp. NPDC097643]|uniref:hypothetical protein n=1 Tax=Kitasatospora sp. NPDC097643 TaxID=3157230 RepID=UPI00331CBB23